MKYTLKQIEFKSIREMPSTERPREKLLASEAGSLSDIELLCILLGRGIRGRPVQDIAADVLDSIDANNGADMKSLLETQGLGTAGAAAVSAALELGRRLGGGRRRAIRNSADVFEHLRHYGDREQEHFLCIILNGALEVIQTQVVTVGLVNKTLVHPREVFREALRRMSTAVILAHNHPSGNLEPSPEDMELTVRMRKAGEILGIEVLDHFIFSSDDYYSMREEGQLWI